MPWFRSLGRPLAALALSSAILAGAACTDSRDVAAPVATPPAPLAPALLAQQIACEVSVRGGTVACQSGANPPAPAPGLHGDLIVGGQHTYTELTSSAPSYNAGTQVFSFDVTVKNLLAQPLNTTDGATGAPAGVRVFFQTAPTVTSGTGAISVLNADGTALFTASSQPYFQYGGNIGGDPANPARTELGGDNILSSAETSAARTWQFHVDNTVGTFSFLLFIAAPVQFETDYFDLAPASASFNTAGATQQLTPTARTRTGAGATGTPTSWASDNTAVATVTSSGLVTVGTTAGTAVITATGTINGVTRTGTARITRTAGAAAQLTKVAGTDNQTATAGTAVSNAPAVKVTDSDGNPVAGVTVTFHVASGGGTITAPPSDVLPLDPALTARADSVARSAVRHQLAAPLAWQPTTTTTAASAATPRLTSIPGDVVTTTSASGIASVGSWVLGPSAGSNNNTLTATAAGAGISGNPATFTASANAGTLDHFLIEKSGGGAISGVVVNSAYALRITAKDVNGNTVTAFNGAGKTVDLTATGATLSGSPVTSGTFTSGVLDPQNVTFTTVGSSVTLTATRTGGAEAGTSAAFAVGVQANGDAITLAPAGNISINTATIATPVSVLDNDKVDAATTVALTSGTVSTVDPTHQQSVLASGATVTIVTSGTGLGTFVYDPPAGKRGTGVSDSFTYQLTSGSSTSSATATLTLNYQSALIWFVNNNAAACTSVAAGCGRLSSPFSTLEAFRAVNDNGAGHPQNNDIVFLYESATSYTVTSATNFLLNGQKMIGQDVSQSLASASGITPPAGSPSLPAMNTGAPATTIGSTVSLASGNQLYGLTLANGTTALSGTSFGTLAVGDVIVNTTGTALSLTTGTVNGAFLSVTGGGATPVALSGVAGTFTVSAGAITGGAGTAFSVSSGTANITWNGTISQSTSGRRGVYLLNNTAGTIKFGGALALSTGTANAFEASAAGGGTSAVEVTVGTSTLAATTGTPLTVSNVAITSNGLHFQSVAANGAANGIVLVNTGSAGGLTVTGTGTAGSGGTIAGITGGDGATNGCAALSGSLSGVGVMLNNTSSVSLAYMNLTGSSNFGILGYSVNGFTMTSVVLSGSHGDNAAQDEDAVHFCNLTGSASITNSTIAGGFEDGLRIRNTTGALNRLTVTGSTFSTPSTAGVNEDDAFHVEARSGAVVNLTVQNSFFTRAAGDLVQTDVLDNSSMDLVFSGNTLSNNHPSIKSAGGGTTFGGGNGGTETFTYDIASNTFRDASGIAVNVFKGLGSGSWSGKVRSNQIGVNGVTSSGSSQSGGIQVQATGNGTFTTAVTGNTIQQYANDAGIMVSTSNGTALTYNGTFTGNTVRQPGGFAYAGIFADIGVLRTANGDPTTDGGTVCLDVGGAGALANILTSSGNAGSGGIADAVLNLNTEQYAVQLPGYGGANNAPATVQTYLAGRNTTGSTAVSQPVAPATGTKGFQSAASCPTPP